MALNLAVRLSLDLPSLILISVFSAFSYYLSRLNLEVETILHQMDDIGSARSNGGNNVLDYHERVNRPSHAVHDNRTGSQYLQFHGD